MEVLDVAQRYLDALVSHDAESVPLAPNARRLSNGRVAVEGADEMRRIIRREPVAALRSLRWLVSGDDAVVFYDLHADMKRGEGPVVAPPEEWMPAYIGERFVIRGGAIHEIEVVYAAAAVGTAPPARPEQAAAGEAAEDEVLSAARAYLAALVSHDASRVPLADGAWRVENGRDTGASGAAIRASLESEVMASVQSVADERWFVSGDAAAVFFTLGLRMGDTEGSVRVAERFRVVGGELAEIESGVGPPSSAD